MLPTKMTEASCAKCHKQQVYVPNADEAERRLRDLRARRLLRLPQDEGLRHQHAEARADPDEDRLEADAGLGEDLDPQSARGQADDLDAALLVQLEQQLAGRRGPQRGRDQRDRRLSVRQHREARVRGQEPAARRREERRGDRQVDRLPGLPRRRRGTRAEVGPRRTFGQPLENIGNKTTYEWIYNWVRDPKHYSPATYMPNLRLTDAQVADVATYLIDAEGAGRRRGEGDARPEGRRRRAARLLARR